MKKILLILSLICFIILPYNVYAANYKLDQNGKYSVAEAYCTYTTKYGKNEYKFKINVKNERLSSIEFIGNKSLGKDMMYFGSLKYSNFFKMNSKTDKDFSCPSKIYLNYDLTKAPMGYYLEQTCDEDLIGAQCNIAEAIPGESNRTYVEQKDDTPQTTIKVKDFSCSYSKQSAVGGSNVQKNSPSVISYYKYKDGTNELIDSSNNKYKVISGSLSDCSKSSIYLEAVPSGGGKYDYKIVSNCSMGTNDKCVQYQKENTTSSVGGTTNDDGTSDDTPELVDPDLIPSKTIKSDLDFETSDKCDSYLGSPTDKNDPAYYLSFAFKLIKYAAILILFGMTIADLIRTVTSQKNDEIQKTLIKALKRLIIAVIIFFLPYLIEYLFGIFGITTDPSCLVK